MTFDFINQNLMTIFVALIGLAVLIIALLVWRTLSDRVQGRYGQRLGVSEFYELDKVRRLVLVRRDTVEHLILIGGPKDVVIERGIGIPGQASSYAAPELSREAAIKPIPIRPAPRPAVFGDRRPSPLAAADPPLVAPRGREPEQP